MGSAAATPGRPRTCSARPPGSPAAAVVVTETSAPFVSWASTRAWASYVELNTAVDSANVPASATMTVPRDRSRRCRDIEAPTTPASGPATGLAARARTRRPWTRPLRASRHVNSAEPIHRQIGASRVR